ncbi:MAG TPA: HlyD family efflux transporter periplasmic adaptor subunit [Candidatus Angelobacter sp.]|nr:HlyD family efflux transporter periplasmic adaptor subunit [Candidatus Angelobacter sp.]
MDIARGESVIRRKKQKRILLTVVAVLAIGGITLGVSRLKPAPPGVEFSTLWPDKVKRGSMLRQVRGLGSLVPIPEDVRTISAATDVQVDRILALPGTPVKADTIIMELSNPQVVQEAMDADQQLKAAQADYLNTKAKVNSDLGQLKQEAATVNADYTDAKRTADSNRELVKIGVLSQQVLDTSVGKEQELATRYKIEQERIALNEKATETQLASSQAKIDQIRALSEFKHKQLDALKVRAGIPGVLEAVPVPVVVGQRATQGTILAKVVQPEHLKAELKIPETQAKDIEIGQAAEVDTHNGIIQGQVMRIDPAAQNGTFTVDVKLEGDLPKGARPDLSVDGTITMEKLDNVLYVGRPAFGQEKSTVGMFRIEPDGKTAVRVPVELGRSSVNAIEIIRGLREGDEVILSDTSRWDNVDRIKLDR